MHYSPDPQVFFFQKNNFKIGSHSTIHTFKNYFAIVFSIFNNKQYPNKPLGLVWKEGMEWNGKERKELF